LEYLEPVGLEEDPDVEEDDGGEGEGVEAVKNEIPQSRSCHF